MQKPFILMIVGGLLSLCVSAQIFSVSQQGSITNVDWYYLMH